MELHATHARLRAQGALVIGAAMAFIVTGGCALTTSPPVPISERQVALRIVPFEANSNNIVIAAYHDPRQKEFVISNATSGQNSAAGFGLIGVSVAVGMREKNARALLPNVDNLPALRLVDALRSRFNSEIAAGRGGRLINAEAETGGTLTISPYVQIFAEDGRTLDVRLYLEAALSNAAKSTIWETRYVYRTSRDRNLWGTGGWMENEAKELRAEVDAGLAAIVEIVLAEFGGGRAGLNRRPAQIRATFPLLGTRTMRGQILREDVQSVVFTPETGTPNILLYGVHIMPRSAVLYQTQSQ